MKHLLRLLFRTYKAQIIDLVIEDLYEQVPSKISQPAFTILAEQQTKITKWLLWQAFTLQRRMVNNPKEAALIMGMLLQIKVTLHMVIGGSTIDEIAPDTVSAEKAKTDRIAREKDDAERLKASVAGAAAFAKGQKPNPQENK